MGTKTLQISGPEVKKKKKKKTDIAIADIKLKKISKLSTASESKSIVGANAEQIHQLLESKNNDQAIPMIYRNMLQTVVDLLPLAERQVRKTKGARGVYQVNTLVSSIRELLNDVQATQDRGMLGQNLVETVVKPGFSDMAQLIMQEYSTISADAKSYMSVEEFQTFRSLLIASRQRMAEKVQNIFLEMRGGTVNFLER